MLRTDGHRIIDRKKGLLRLNNAFSKGCRGTNLRNCLPVRWWTLLRGYHASFCWKRFLVPARLGRQVIVAQTECSRSQS